MVLAKLGPDVFQLDRFCQDGCGASISVRSGQGTNDTFGVLIDVPDVIDVPAILAIGAATNGSASYRVNDRVGLPGL